MIDVDTIATDEDLDSELGGTGIAPLDALSILLRPGTTTARAARVKALERVLESLARRSPPVREAALLDVAQLQRAVVLGALEQLLEQAMTSDGDVFAVRRRLFAQRFAAELAGLTPRLSGGGRVVIGMSVVRR